MNRLGMWVSFKIVIIKGVVRFFSLPSLSVLHKAGAVLGWLSWRFDTHLAKVTRKNLSLCFPEQNIQNREDLVKASLKETAKMLFETGKIWTSPKHYVIDKVVNVRGEDYLQEAVAKNQGLIVLAPHIGAWEVFGYYLGTRIDCTILYQPPKIRELEELVVAARTRSNNHLVATDRKGIVKLLKTLSNNGSVGILPDQEPTISAGIFAPFFGVSALTGKLASKLATKAGARAICGMAIRLPQGKGYEIVFSPVDELFYSSDEIESATGLNRSIETCVDIAKPQYQWEYKRFRNGPNGKTRYYQFNWHSKKAP